MHRPDEVPYFSVCPGNLTRARMNGTTRIDTKNMRSAEKWYHTSSPSQYAKSPVVGLNHFNGTETGSSSNPYSQKIHAIGN
jgi:hypothetical protein